MIYGVFDDVDIRSESRYDELTTEFDQVTLDLTHELTDELRLHALVGRAQSKHDNPVQTTLLFDRIDADGYAYDYRQNPNLPLISYGFDVTNPASYALTQIRLRPQTADNTFDNLEVDLAWAATERLTFKTGVSIKEFDFATTELRRSNGTTTNLEAIVTGQAGTPLSRNTAGSSSSRIRGNCRRARSRAGSFPTLHARTRCSISAASRSARSRRSATTAPFARRTRACTCRSTSMPRSAACRCAATQACGTYKRISTRSAISRRANTPVLVEVDRDYDDVLPSVNFVLEVTDEFWVRLGYSEVITRPGLGNLTPGGTISVSGNNRTVNVRQPVPRSVQSGCNRRLLRVVLQRRVLLALALFHKDISTFPQSVSETRPFTGNSLGCPTAPRSRRAERRRGLLRRPPTGCSRSRSTAPAAISRASRSRISRLSASGIGVMLNYTHVTSADRLHRPVVADWH